MSGGVGGWLGAIPASRPDLWYTKTVKLDYVVDRKIRFCCATAC